ncbi:MAG: Uma2 family endonuclease [Myxacorys chilensis ATA2-1-KO14]|jgi:Uma2 family endonuclease|nr:Uma2 family endonuclease [Myxacorys chilensis ATA2-1-KO14]
MLITDRVAPPIGEKRVTVRNLDWQAYQQLRSLLEHRTHARLTYDRGTLEITMPLEEHEFASEMIALFVRVLVTEMGLKLKSMGSTTLDREDLKRGAEPDKGFYIQNQQVVAGRTVDLATDPAPDLIVEVDITNTDIDKNELYANLGIPEFWRFNGREWQIYQLQGKKYVERDRTPTFPIVEKTDLYHFLEACQQDEIAAESNFRAWVRQKLAQS